MPDPRDAKPVGDDGAFKKAPTGERDFFRLKGQHETFSWRDTLFDEHAASFTVAKSAGYDILGDIRTALQRAIDDREDFATFATKLQPILEAKGWWGKKVATDPLTGETRPVQLGSPRRLQIIHWANVRTARAAGEWERIQRTKAGLPFLEYLHTTAAHPREEHLAWVGTILPADDEWWDTHFPPCAWLCQCRVLQLTAGAARRKGYDPAVRPAYDGMTTTFHNGRTGETRRVPKGVAPGWDTNPGKYRMDNLRRLWDDKLGPLPEEARRIATEDMTRQPIFETIAQGRTGYDRDHAAKSDANVQRGRFALPVASTPAPIAAAVSTDAPLIKLSVADGAKQAQNHPELRPADYANVQAALDAATATVPEPERRLFHVFSDIGAGSFKIVLQRAAATGELFLKSFHFITRGRARERAAMKARELAKGR